MWMLSAIYFKLLVEVTRNLAANALVVHARHFTSLSALSKRLQHDFRTQPSRDNLVEHKGMD